MNNNDIQSILSALAKPGWIKIPNFLSSVQTQSLRQLADQRLQQGDFRQAGIGSNSRLRSNTEIRGDQICWLNRESGADANPVCVGFCQFLDGLRLQLNQALYLGLFESELHLALYPPGGRYQKHIDNFHGRSPRVITLILYLNEDWQPEEGGELRLYVDDVAGGRAAACTAGNNVNKSSYTDIIPQGGTLVIFLSERFYHEVLPATRERLSLTGWLRRREV